MKTIVKSLFCILGLAAIVSPAQAILTGYFKHDPKKNWSGFFRTPVYHQAYHPAFSCCQGSRGKEIKRPDWCEAPTAEHYAALTTVKLATLVVYVPSQKYMSPVVESYRAKGDASRKDEAGPVVYAMAWIPKIIT